LKNALDYESSKTSVIYEDVLSKLVR